jgi:S1-C subfamily serine protease
MRPLIATFLLAVAACGAKVKVDPMPGEMDDPAAGDPRASMERAPEHGSIAIAPAAPVKTAPAGPGVRSMSVARASVDAALDAGPGAFLRGFEVAAVLDQGKFVGWRLVRVIEGEHRFDGLDLQPGDVLLDVNGMPVSQPDQLAALFDSLRGANQIVVDLARGNASFQLKLTIAATSPPHP